MRLNFRTRLEMLRRNVMRTVFSSGGISQVVLYNLLYRTPWISLAWSGLNYRTHVVRSLPLRANWHAVFCVVHRLIFYYWTCMMCIIHEACSVLPSKMYVLGEWRNSDEIFEVDLCLPWGLHTRATRTHGVVRWTVIGLYLIRWLKRCASRGCRHINVVKCADAIEL